MEFLLELLGSVLAEACCEIVLAVGLDALTGVAGYKTYQKRQQARRHGEPAPPPDAWSRLFKVLLPLAVLLTGLVVAGLVHYHNR
jgi:hypothetical protein